MSESNGKPPREILFRGKETYVNFYGRRININVWREGSYIHQINSHKIKDFTTGVEYEVDPETAGQYTGLKDKNGAKIFEGDIVSYQHAAYNYANCLIKYEPAKAGFCLIALHDDITTNESFEKGDVMSLYIPMGDVEVIGNIHDNPELLKGAQ